MTKNPMIAIPGALVIFLFGGGIIHAEDRRESTVGLPARIDGLVLPGPELEVKPLVDHRAPLVLRITHVWPHGTAFRYDLEYYALEPDKYDLRTLLRRKDGSSLADVPAIPVEVRSVLPSGQVRPSEVQLPPAPRLGGYQIALIGAGAVWALGLMAILLVGRRRRAASKAAVGRARTLADHLQPLVEGAVAGKLSAAQLAELERALLVYWERRLELGQRKPAQLIEALRRHPEAGPLIRQLEIWLHQPPAPREVDVETLLRPYRDLPDDPLETDARRRPEGATLP
jgi:hypothetical protein